MFSRELFPAFFILYKAHLEVSSNGFAACFGQNEFCFYVQLVVAEAAMKTIGTSILFLIANDLFGNIKFEASGKHLEVGNENSETLYRPFAAVSYQNKLIVADTGNHRIAFYKT